MHSTAYMNTYHSYIKFSDTNIKGNYIFYFLKLNKKGVLSLICYILLKNRFCKRKFRSFLF